MFHQTNTLTIGADIVTGSAGDDTFSGARVDTIQTWSSTDTVAGGAGTDSLSAVIATDVQPGVGAVTGVENLTVTALTNGDANAAVVVTFSDTTDTFISGVSSITNLASSDPQGLTFARVTELATVTVNNSAAPTVVQFADAVLAGTADSVTLNVNGATGDITIGTVTTADGDYETLNIATSGAASSFDGRNLDADVTTLNISGSGDLTLTNAAFANIGSVVSTASGDVSLILAGDGVTGTTNTKTVTMGAGGDTLDVSAIDPTTVGAVSVNMGAGNDTVILGARGATDFTVVGGAGTDSVSISVDADAALHGNVSGFERLIATGANGTQNMALFTGNTGFTTLRSAQDTDFTNVGSAVLALELATGSTGTVSIDRLVDGSADSLAVSTRAAISVTTLNVADEESVTINSALGALTATGGVTATDLTSLVVTGSASVDLSTVTGAAVATVNVTGLTGAAVFTADFTSAAAITLTANTATTDFTGTIQVSTGAGNDVITGTANADSITGNGGNDTINGGAGIDNISGGAGDDTVNGDAGNDIITGGSGADTINGGAGNDSIRGGQGNDALTGGAGADTFIFEAASAQLNTNGADTILDFVTGADGDVLNFGLLVGTLGTGVTAATDLGLKLAGGSGADAISATATGVDIDGQIAMFKGDADTAAEVANLFAAASNGAGKFMFIDSAADGSEQAVVISGEDNSSTVYVWVVTNTATAGVEAAEVSLMSTITLTNGDIDDLALGNFSYLA